MSFNFFVILAVCWLMIFDGQVCMSNSQLMRMSVDPETAARQENATNLHELPKKSPDCLPRDDYDDLLPIGIYKLHTRVATWNVARNICREEGAHLAIINSKAEAIVLSTMLSRIGDVADATYQDLAFIGIHDQFKEGDWVTVLDDSIYAAGYTEWSDKWGGQPDDTDGTRNCGAMVDDGTLDDTYCDINLPFFCEKSHPDPCGGC